MSDIQVARAKEAKDKGWNVVVPVGSGPASHFRNGEADLVIYFLGWFEITIDNRITIKGLDDQPLPEYKAVARIVEQLKAVDAGARASLLKLIEKKPAACEHIWGGWRSNYDGDLEEPHLTRSWQERECQACGEIEVVDRPVKNEHGRSKSS